MLTAMMTWSAWFRYTCSSLVVQTMDTRAVSGDVYFVFLLLLLLLTVPLLYLFPI